MHVIVVVYEVLQYQYLFLCPTQLNLYFILQYLLIPESPQPVVVKQRNTKTTTEKLFRSRTLLEMEGLTIQCMRAPAKTTGQRHSWVHLRSLWVPLDPPSSTSSGHEQNYINKNWYRDLSLILSNKFYLNGINCWSFCKFDPAGELWAVGWHFYFIIIIYISLGKILENLEYIH